MINVINRLLDGPINYLINIQYLCNIFIKKT